VYGDADAEVPNSRHSDLVAVWVHPDLADHDFLRVGLLMNEDFQAAMRQTAIAAGEDPAQRYRGLCTKLECAACSFDAPTIYAPQRCPRCGSCTFQHYEGFELATSAPKTSRRRGRNANTYAIAS
jgi:hypothetical protein